MMEKNNFKNIPPIFENDLKKCCGCSACVTVCPTQALIMQQNKEGFYYPALLSSKCVLCNRCKRVCPVLEVSNKDS